MKQINYIIILALSILQSNFSFGQETSFLDSIQINKFLENPKLNKNIKDFYSGQFKVSDDNKTQELLDTITEKNVEFFPVYFNTLNKIVQHSDGALAEMLPEFCFKMIYNYPIETFKFFTRNQKLLLDYADLLGYEFYFKKKGTSDLKMKFNEFQEYLKTRIDLNEKSINKAYSEFVMEVKETMKKMN